MKKIGWLLILTGIGTISYWINFFFFENVQIGSDNVYLAFESAFPLADAWLTVFALLGGIGLIREKCWAPACSFIAASALIFLCLLDLKFNLDQGTYWKQLSVPVMIEIMINIWAMFVGVITIVANWKNCAQRCPARLQAPA